MVKKSRVIQNNIQSVIKSLNTGTQLYLQEINYIKKIINNNINVILRLVYFSIFTQLYL